MKTNSGLRSQTTRKCILILGGSRSGKSTYAESLAERHEGPHIYDADTVLEYKAAALPPVQNTPLPYCNFWEKKKETFKPLVEDFGPEHEKYTCLLCWKYACVECGYASNCWHSCPWCSKTVSNTPQLSPFAKPIEKNTPN